MKTLYLIIILFSSCLWAGKAQAQNERRDTLPVSSSYGQLHPHFGTASQIVRSGVKISPSAYDRGAARQGLSVNAPAPATDSLSAAAGPRALEDLTVPADILPYYAGGMSPYSLHEGLNVSMDLSMMVQSGKHARSGAGFSQRVDATYVMPLSNRWWATAGGYLDHLSWGGDHYFTSGLYGELGYQINDHWSASIYAQKSLYNRNAGFSGFYGYGRYTGRRGFGFYAPWDYADNFGDKIGTCVRWSPNKNFSVGVSLEYDKYPKTFVPYGKSY